MNTPMAESQPLFPVPTISTPLATHRLRGKVALITGGAGNIGLETASRFLREGANIVLVDINARALEAAGQTLKQALVTGEVLSTRCVTVKADVTVEEDVEKYVQQTLRAFNRLDIVFLNAGMSYKATPLLETNVEDYDTIMDVNVKSAFLGLKHCAAAMKELGNGGSIILTSSIAGLRGTPGLSLYSGSKFALRGLALTAANELGQYGIRVNTVHPSGVDGPMFRKAWSEEKLEELKNAMPLGRFAQADDVASVVAFLGHEDSKFMTGGFLKVDGGCVNF